MVIEVLYMSKNATTRHRTKSDFAVTYCFRSSTCISGLFLFKIGSKCADFCGVPKSNCNRLKTVRLRVVFGGLFILKSMQPQPPVRFSPVSVVFSVHATGPSNTIQMQTRIKISEQKSTMSKARKRTGRGRKKRASNRGKCLIPCCTTCLIFFFSKMASQRAAQDVAADAAGPPVHLTR